MEVKRAYMEWDLILPQREFESSYRQYIVELGDEERYPMPMDLDHRDFSKLIQTLEDFRHGRNLPIGKVANTTLWLIHQQELVGVSNIRHRLNDELKNAGGHIGLGIRPSYRGKGLGSALLSQTIEFARAFPINHLHIHCHTDNLPSCAMIERNNGKLDSQICFKGERINRYIVTQPN